MHWINKNYLNSIKSFKDGMDGQINAFFHQVLYNEGLNFFETPHYRLYSLITENVKMDLNSLISLNVDYDVFGFLAIRRNLRNSIEAHYDLFNLTNDGQYLSLLKCRSRNVAKEEKYCIQLGEYSKYREGKFTIKEKAEIAKKYGLDDKKYEFLKSISTESNSYIHPDIFIPIMNIEKKNSCLKKLLYIDCLLLAESFDLLLQCYTQFTGRKLAFDCYFEFQRLQAAIVSCDCII